MKNSNDTIGNEPATFRFVAQRLNHCATAVPIPASVYYISTTDAKATYECWDRVLGSHLNTYSQSLSGTQVKAAIFLYTTLYNTEKKNPGLSTDIYMF